MDEAELARFTSEFEQYILAKVNSSEPLWQFGKYSDHAIANQEKRAPFSRTC